MRTFQLTNIEINIRLLIAPLPNSQMSPIKIIHLIKVVSGHLLTFEKITKTSTKHSVRCRNVNLRGNLENDRKGIRTGHVISNEFQISKQRACENLR